MISFKTDILDLLLKAGYNTTRIRKEKIFPEGVLTKFRNQGPISIATLDKLCTILKCQPGDLISWAPDPGRDD